MTHTSKTTVDKDEVVCLDDVTGIFERRDLTITNLHLLAGGKRVISLARYLEGSSKRYTWSSEGMLKSFRPKLLLPLEYLSLSDSETKESKIV